MVTPFVVCEGPGEPVSSTAANSSPSGGAVESGLPGHLPAKIRSIIRTHLNYHWALPHARSLLSVHFKTPSLEPSLAPSSQPVLMKLSTPTLQRWQGSRDLTKHTVLICWWISNWWSMGNRTAWRSYTSYPFI